MNTKIVFVLILIMGFIGTSQNSNSYDYCSIDQIDKGVELCKAIQHEFGLNLTVSQAEKAVNKILKSLDIKKDFVLVSCPDIENAVAVKHPSDGVKYIVFDPKFMKDIVDNSSSWSNLWILSHEIGHHILGHSSLPPTGKDLASLEKGRQRELDADSFAGSSLFKLGASLEQAKQAIIQISSEFDDKFTTHPKLSRRLKAISDGYYSANEITSAKPIAKEPVKNGEFYYAEAEKFIQNQKFEEAIASYSFSIKSNPQFALAYLGRAWARDNLGRDKEALNDYDKCIALQSNISTAYNNRAILRENSGDVNEAISDFTKAISLQPNNFIYYANRASSFEEIGDYYKAIEDYSKAILLEPNDADLYGDRAYAKRVIENFSSAIEDYNKALKLNPRDGSILMMRAFTYRYWGKQKKAKKDFKKCCSDFNRGDCCQNF